MLIELAPGIAVDPETVVAVRVNDYSRVVVALDNRELSYVIEPENKDATACFNRIVKEINDACLKTLEERRRSCCACSFANGTWKDQRTTAP